MRTLGESLHRNAYLALQALRGRPVGQHMRRLQAWETMERSEFQRFTAQMLEDTLAFARESVPLYGSGRWRDALARNPVRLQSWPVLERQWIKSHADELISRRKPLGSFYRSSSASTGEPVRVAWSPQGAAAGWANEHQAFRWHGLDPGARTILFWGYGNQAVNWIRNYKVFRTTELTPSLLEQATRWLIEKRPRLCVGLPSAIAEWAHYVRAHHPELPKPLVPYMKLGGEQIYRFQRESLEQYFGSRVVETYGCTEVGPIAVECPVGSMHILETNVHIEIHRNGEPVGPGEPGDVIATSLSNRAMPLVRCKIGDQAQISPDPCACGRPYRVLENLLGRSSDSFLGADGTPVHGSVLGQGLRTVLAAVPLDAIRQVLFQQIDQRRWKVLVESGTGFDDLVARKLTELVHTTFGTGCRVDIERISLVPREASGKYRYYRPGPRPGASCATENSLGKCRIGGDTSAAP